MALVERHQRSDKITLVKSEIPLNYLYSAGRAGEKFLTEIRDNEKIVGTYCEACDITYVPPRIYCERCFERLEDSYREVPGRGTVESYTLSYENFDGTRKEDPTIVAMIMIDGTDGGLVHWLGEIDPEDVFIGLMVEAVYKPKEEREGSVLDIKYFKPL